MTSTFSTEMLPSAVDELLAHSLVTRKGKIWNAAYTSSRKAIEKIPSNLCEEPKRSVALQDNASGQLQPVSFNAAPIASVCS